MGQRRESTTGGRRRHARSVVSGPLAVVAAVGMLVAPAAATAVAANEPLPVVFEATARCRELVVTQAPGAGHAMPAGSMAAWQVTADAGWVGPASAGADGSGALSWVVHDLEPGQEVTIDVTPRTDLGADLADRPSQELVASTLSDGCDAPAPTLVGHGTRSVLLSRPTSDGLPRIELTAVDGVATATQPSLDVRPLGGLLSVERPTGAAVTIEVDDVPLEVPAAEELTRLRLRGPDRFATAAAVARWAAEQGPVERIALVPGDQPVAGLLAASTGMPVLFTESAALPTATAEVLAELAPVELHLIGLEGTIDRDVADQAVALAAGSVVQTVAPDLVSLSVGVANQFDDADAARTPVLLSSVRASADIVSAAAWHRPLLLTEPEGLSDVTGAWLRDRPDRAVTVVGGPAAVSDQVLLDLDGLTGEAGRAIRVSGPDRSMTSAALVSHAGNGASVGDVAVVAGDALVDGVVAAGLGLPVVLTLDGSRGGGGLDAVVAGPPRCQVRSLVLVGGPAALEDSAVQTASCAPDLTDRMARAETQLVTAYQNIAADLGLDPYGPVDLRVLFGPDATDGTYLPMGPDHPMAAVSWITDPAMTVAANPRDDGSYDVRLDGLRTFVNGMETHTTTWFRSFAVDPERIATSSIVIERD